MSDRIEEIRAHLKLLERPHSIRINVSARPPTADIAGVGAAYVSAPPDIAFLLAEVERLQSRAAPDFAWEPAGEDRFAAAMGIVKGRVFTFEGEWHWEVSTSSAEMRTVYAGSIIEDHPERRTKEDAMKQCEAAMLATIGIGAAAVSIRAPGKQVGLW